MPAETFWTLLHSLGHWEFEIFLMVVFDGLVGALLYPWASRHIKHHLLRDRRDLIADNTSGCGFIPMSRKTYDDPAKTYSDAPPPSDEFTQPPESKFDYWYCNLCKRK